jgi:hypothetical protein
MLRAPLVVEETVVEEEAMVAVGVTIPDPRALPLIL